MPETPKSESSIHEVAEALGEVPWYICILTAMISPPLCLAAVAVLVIDAASNPTAAKK